MEQLIKAEPLSKHDIERGCFAKWRVKEGYAGFARYKFDAYMEAGLNQEQIYQLLADRRINLADKEVVGYRDYLSLGTLAELTALSKARDEGRVLPCKRGDKVWRICGPKGRKFVAERKVMAVAMYSPGQFNIFTNCSDWLGQTVFLTRAEAEAALIGAVDHETN